MTRAQISETVSVHRPPRRPVAPWVAFAAALVAACAGWLW